MRNSNKQLGVLNVNLRYSFCYSPQTHLLNPYKFSCHIYYLRLWDADLSRSVVLATMMTWPLIHRVSSNVCRYHWDIAMATTVIINMVMTRRERFLEWNGTLLMLQAYCNYCNDWLLMESESTRMIAMATARFLANTRHPPDVGFRLDQHRRRWANLKPTLGESLVWLGCEYSNDWPLAENGFGMCWECPQRLWYMFNVLFV